ncbi:hypothetical protein [Bosea sp. BH3]|uniref:hypothetical protein n=1 Tax=Bosea sp. BH3 TaxID=2871701 RepID=UPI0021CB453A|nr:hypothetical protein [Bosea sp. BH3]MCU4179918.1 hypothetical protein [Bosea sp. BH3]
MLTQSSFQTSARRFSSGLPFLGLVLAAGLSWAPAPAAAADNSWHSTCQFRNIPGSGGEMLRYDACLRLETCQRMANAAGHTIFEAGCFGFAPEVPASPTGAAPARQAR